MYMKDLDVVRQVNFILQSQDKFLKCGQNLGLQRYATNGKTCSKTLCRISKEGNPE